ncbi:hypothetical protein BHE74_00027884 [Ensete ventricosum]|nr:hypothetical protein BHE74_00027884 [Ensete ventricosum]
MAVIVRWTAFSLSSLVVFPSPSATARLSLPGRAFSRFTRRISLAASAPAYPESGIGFSFISSPALSPFDLVSSSSLCFQRVHWFRRSHELQSPAEGDGIYRTRSKLPPVLLFFSSI